MIKLLRVLSCLFIGICFLQSAGAQTWKPVGADENDLPSISQTFYNNVVIAPDGTPYVAYIDMLVGGKVTVKKFNGSIWEPVGAVGFSDYASSATLTIAADGTLYATYQAGKANSNISDWIYVKKFNGSAWVDVSPPANTPNNIIGVYNSLAVASDGTLYLSYAGTNYFASGNMAYVLKFSGGVWTDLRPPNKGSISAGGTSFNKIVVAPDGTPYIAYSDNQQFNKVTVKKYTNNAWSSVGAEGITPSAVMEMSMAIAPDGTPYIAYPDAANSNKLSVQKYNSASGFWSNVGTAGFTVGEAISTYIAFAPDGTPMVTAIDVGLNKKTVAKLYKNGSWTDIGGSTISTGQTSYATTGTYNYNGISVAPDGTPYVIYQDNLLVSKAVVKKFTGGAWITVGPAGISPDEAGYFDLKLDPNDVPYVAYTDAADSYKAYVKKYVNGSWQTVGASFSQAKTSGQNVSVNLAVAPNGTPYVIYTDQIGSTYTALVKTFNGTSWAQLGANNSFSTLVLYQKIIVAPDGTPYVVYIDNSVLNSTLSVKKYSGGGWINVGNANFATALSDPQIAMAPDGTLYTSCENAVSSGANNVYTNYVYKLVGNTWQSMPSTALPYNLNLNSNLAVGADNTPYISFNDATTNNASVVKSFNGTSWVALPQTGLATGYMPTGNLVTAPDGSLYMTFDSTNVTTSSIRHIKKYKNGAWADVGTGRPAPGYSSVPVLALPKTGEIMMGYSNGQVFVTQPTTDIATAALAPAIISFAPAIAGTGDTVIIKGTNFHTSASYSGVKNLTFGGLKISSYTVNSDKQITVIIGSGATGNVSVTTFNGTATAPGFTYAPTPVVTYNRPTTFNSGDSVVLTANPSVGYTYQWYLNSVVIPGATSSSYTAYRTGSYTVSMTTLGVVTKTSGLGVYVTVNFTPPVQNFYVTVTGATCKGAATGSIVPRAANITNTVNYTATLTGNNVSLTGSFTYSTTLFNNLAAGTYNLCFTAASLPNFHQCQTITIVEPKDITLYTTAISKDNKILTLTMGGASIYNIQLNGVLYSTKDSVISIPVKPGNNHLIITSDKPCQGVIDQMISVSDDAAPYPNPFENVINLNISDQKVALATIEIYSSSGYLVYKKQFVNPANNIVLDVSTIKTPGMYILNLFTDHYKRVFKIVKK